MSFKTFFSASLFSSALLLLPQMATAAPAAYDIDMSHANVMFDVDHQGFSSLAGRFGKFSASLSFDAENIANSEVAVVIATDSVDTFHSKRDEHLRSPDFFNSAEFPEMTFSSNKIEQTGDNTAVVFGELTLLGVTKPVQLDLVVNKTGVNQYNKKTIAGFSASGTIKRSEFGMKYGIPNIGDTINLQIELEAIKK